MKRLNKLDPIDILEGYLERFTSIVNGAARYWTTDDDDYKADDDQGFFKPWGAEDMALPFAGQDGEFSRHVLRFYYVMNNHPHAATKQAHRWKLFEILKCLHEYAGVLEAFNDDVFLDTDINMNFPFFKRVKSFDMLKEKVYEVSCGKGASCLNISFIEGFIGDGKTQFLANINTFDSELDFFYRAELLENKYGYKYMPEVFYRCFALLGIYGAICSSVLDNTPLFIDPSWISHDYFDKHGESRFPYKPKTEPGVFSHDFFASLILLTEMTQLSQTRLLRIMCVDVSFYFRQTPIEMPWPFHATRQMEQELYPTQNKLAEHYKRFYLILNKYFMSTRSLIFSPVAGPSE